MAFFYIHLIILSLTILSSNAADPAPLQDFCIADLKSHLNINGYPCKNPSETTSADFFYSGFTGTPKNYNSDGLDLNQATPTEFPGINTLGISMNQVNFLPGGLNSPHIHPRATELSLVTEGKIYAGWISSDNILYAKVLGPGELFVIPPGLVHFQMNVGKGNAQFYASFNSQNPGVQRVANALFDSTPLAPDAALSKAFRVNETIIELIKSKFSQQRRP